MNKIMPNPPDNTFEEWRPVSGYEGLYSISNLGNVRREKGYMCHETHLISVRTNRSGYPSVQLTSGAKNKGHLVHRLIAKAFIPLVEGKNHINHKNGIRTDFRIDNLEWCTIAENNWHQVHVLNTGPKCGETAYNATLTEQEALEIIRLYSDGVRLADISRKLGIHHGTCENIVRGRTWKHLPKDREKTQKRFTRGEDMHMAKLNESQVIEIRRLNSGGLRYSSLARAFNVAPETIRLICIGKHWKHLL
jgi:transposase-like protein